MCLTAILHVYVCAFVDIHRRFLLATCMYMYVLQGITWMYNIITCFYSFQASNCTSVIFYSVNISSKEKSMTRNFTSEVCSSSQCSYEIDFTQNITSDVIVDFYADGSLISTTTIGMCTVHM